VSNNFGDKWREMGPYLLLLLLPTGAYSFETGLCPLYYLAYFTPLHPTSESWNWWQDNVENAKTSKVYKLITTTI